MTTKIISVTKRYQ